MIWSFEMPKPYLSSSRLETFWRCGEQYRRRYEERHIVPPGIALLVGTGLHVGSETNFRQKIESHVDLPIDDVIDAAVAGFETRLHKDSFELTSEEQSIGAKKIIAQAKDQVAALAEIHAIEQAPDYQPIAVEAVTLIELPGTTHDLLTVTDLRDDMGRVVDLKTSGAAKTQHEVDASIQLTAYAAAYRADYGVDPTEVRLDVLKKTKRVDRQILKSTRGEADYLVLANRIDATLAAINAGIFTPTSPISWQCSERWCGYARTCPYFAKK
ncbi:MAG: hypothetical protein E6Q97_08060 [Desulfurellales bacterium]|nr:MAG: hypothetical protein E6Q97_08060 [Desulfurellales bacterium]